MPELFDAPYDAKTAEERIYKLWEESGFFAPEAHQPLADNLHKQKTFSMVLPPPNVTGILHIGHALMLTIEDIMARYHRMMGDKTLWIPGTDHAAIATQEKVERELYKKEGKNRHDLGREEFLRRVGEFVKQNHDTIVHQMKKMGASLDWSREAFTLDEPRTRAVHEAFKRMYDAGLIYRGERIVNWDPKLQTTVSDDEIEWKEEKAPFYYLKYGPFTISTARPETKFGDKYVVMHPDDKRYKQYKEGQKLEVEWMNGKITATVIKDKAVDPKFGTGVMTITPWHDAVDFEIAERHKLDREQIIDLRGKLLPIAGEFAGKKITEARPLIVEKLKAKGLLEKVDESYVHRIATDSRGGGVIEPQILKQWFVNVNAKFKIQKSKLKNIPSGSETTLKEIMTKAVKSGQIKIIPERFKKIYFHWINNLRDWCISRQIWYGHRIPVWYCLQCGQIETNIDIKSRWFILRHGQSEWNSAGIVQGQSDGNSLTSKGVEQARQAAAKLKSHHIDLVISSDLKRAAETASIIAEIVGAKVVCDKRLRERHMGTLQGKLKNEVESDYLESIKGYTTKSEGGESFEDIEKRAWEAFREHQVAYKGKNIVVVTHGGIILALNKKVKNLEFGEAVGGSVAKNGEGVQLDVAKSCSHCGGDLYEQDPDTLDTWFSSGLWTFSTLGWPAFAETATVGKPGKENDFANFHPTSVLETGYDILFFWVARMILMTGFLLGDIPFETVYLHGLVRDAQGKKMSKSLGNVIDPLVMSEKYGADATRLSLIIGTAPGNDTKLSEDRVRGYRNFTTKIWNIARFIVISDASELKGVKPKTTVADKKRLKEFESLKKTITISIEKFKFHKAGETLYHYLWHTFADKIIEESKPRLKGDDRADAAASLATLQEVFYGCLKLLHPFMPFVTEEIYQLYFKAEKKHPFLMVAPW